ncbi:hypothetical protein [Flavobacterium sp. XS2P14]|uniref:hypothetical protein n=1 Tax=Flavobacterium sp. XS2P14 TaxID=3401735 RepID=UPI003AAC7A56
MILGFSTQLNGKPTYFVEKILIGIDKHLGIYHTELFIKAFKEKFESTVPVNYNSKIHTMREDKKERWKPGTKIDFFINCRQVNMFRFAPVLPVVSVQKVHIMYKPESVFFARTYPADVYIDERWLGVHEIAELAHNDGFDTIEDFFAYFNQDFTGKLIHWTDLRY